MMADRGVNRHCLYSDKGHNLQLEGDDSHYSLYVTYTCNTYLFPLILLSLGNLAPFNFANKSQLQIQLRHRVQHEFRWTLALRTLVSQSNEGHRSNPGFDSTPPDLTDLDHLKEKAQGRRKEDLKLKLDRCAGGYPLVLYEVFFSRALSHPN